MTKTELMHTCNSYGGDEDGFAGIIRGFVDLDEGNTTWLSRQFHLLAFRTVQDWSFGYTSPAGFVRSQVVNTIKIKLTEKEHLHVL